MFDSMDIIAFPGWVLNQMIEGFLWLIGAIWRLIELILFQPVEFVVDRPWIRTSFIVIFMAAMHLMFGGGAIGLFVEGISPPRGPQAVWFIWGAVLAFYEALALVWTYQLLTRPRRQRTA